MSEKTNSEVIVGIEQILHNLQTINFDNPNRTDGIIIKQSCKVVLDMLPFIEYNDISKDVLLFVRGKNSEARRLANENAGKSTELMYLRRAEVFSEILAFIDQLNDAKQ